MYFHFIYKLMRFLVFFCFCFLFQKTHSINCESWGVRKHNKWAQLHVQHLICNNIEVSNNNSFTLIINI